MTNGMITMGKIEKFIKNRVFRIHDEITEMIPSVNGIISNDNMISVAAWGSVQRAARSLESFVTITEDYPKQDYTDVTFKTDLITMRTEDYKKLIEYIKDLEDGDSETR